MRPLLTVVCSTHPRVGGEDAYVGSLPYCDVDSPPRGRGRQRRHHGERRRRRLTPAWAGKTALAGHRSGGASTHPRVGGEDGGVRAWGVSTGDSPPRGRGRRFAACESVGAPRLTPAWAGKTRHDPRRRGIQPTHPRVGGEDRFTSQPDAIHDDSPPRGRGRPPGARRRPRGGRLTPAWAGKTCCTTCRRRAPTTHPRVGGEDRNTTGGSTLCSDSPPRGRGRRHPPVRAPPGDRLTPAWAGKTRTPPRRAWVPATHPRVGGED